MQTCDARTASKYVCRLVGFSILLLSSELRADAVLELIPETTGPFVSGQVVPVEVWLHNSESIDIDLRHVELDFRGLQQKLFVGGLFQIAGGSAVNYIAVLDGGQWVPIDGVQVGGPVNAISQVTTPTSIDLYIGGETTNIIHPYLVKWNGQTTFGTDLDNTLGRVFNLVTLEDETDTVNFLSGENLRFGNILGEASRWDVDAQAWDPIPYILGGVRDVALYGNGTPPQAYISGPFGYYYPGPALERIFSIAKLTENGWTPVGHGLRFGIGPTTANALAVFDDGNGPRLFVAGDFRRSYNTPLTNIVTHKISKWNGSTWSAVGGGINPDLPGVVNDMVVLDDGSGPALYVAGTFQTAGGIAVSNIARWNGIEWRDVGGGVTGGSSPSIKKLLEVKNECGGSALVAGGSFTNAGGVTVSNVAIWDGYGWSPVGNGVDNEVRTLVSAYVEGALSTESEEDFEFDLSTLPDPGYFVVPTLPNPSITYALQTAVTGRILRLPASGSLRIGTLNLVMPEGNDDYAIDVASPLAANGGAEVRYGFGGPGDPLVTISAQAGTLTGIPLEFEQGFRSVGTPCGDAADELCDHADTCSGEGVCLQNREPNGTACFDGDLCTLADSCQSGVCEPGEDPLVCLPDSNQCTNDYCDPLMGCVHPNKPDGTCCNDGSSATHCDKCVNGNCNGSKSLSCIPCGNPED